MTKENISAPTKRKRKRYIPDGPNRVYEKIYLVFYYNIQKHTIIRDGPFVSKAKAYKKMQERTLEGYCAWIVTYND